MQNVNQTKAIESRADRITVSASAGTGKTWVLTNRYFSILNVDGVSPNDILTLTYTQSAASDMKKRIQSRFSDSVLGQTWISTIHAFASRLLKQSGLTLDLDPASSVISPRQQSDFWQSLRLALMYSDLHSLTLNCKDEILNETANFLDKSEILSSALNKWSAQKLVVLAEKFSDLYNSRGYNWREILENSENDNMILKTSGLLKNILKAEWDKVFEEWRDIKELPKPKTLKSGSPAEMLLDLIKQHDEMTSEDFYSALILDKSIRANAHEPFKTLKDILGMTLTDYRNSQPKIIRTVSYKFKNPPLEQELELRKVLIKFCALSWGVWEITKRRRGLLSFSDMISNALKAIEEGAVNKNFAHILVDEFQDTDPLQFRMIKSLAMQSKGNSIFTVGDPKQSIYRFRHAEPELFAQSISEADIEVNLDVSFRTRKSLLNLVNRIFGEVWKNSLGSSQAMSRLNYKPLKAAELSDKRNEGSMKDFEVILQLNEREAVKDLAMKLACKLRKCIDEHKTIWDKERQEIRELKYSDIAILCRNRNYYDVIEQVFSVMGIKVIQDKSTGYFARGEVNDVISMLKACSDFNDDVSVSGWLMSPFSGASEEDALRCLKLKSKDKSLHVIDIIRSELPEIYSRLEYLALVGEVKGAASLIEIFDKDRGWLENYKENERLRIIRNLRRAINIALSFEDGVSSGLYACGEWLGSAISSGVSLDEPSWHDEGENAVLLTTIHGAKGLEYPVAVIFETLTKAYNGSKGLRESDNLGVVFPDLPDELKNGNTKEDLKFSDWDKLLDIQGENEESMRLFYVAMTRAQDAVIFCSLLNNSGEPYESSWTKVLYKTIPDYMPEMISENDFKNENTNLKIKTVIDNAEIEFKNIILNKNIRKLKQISASSFSLYEYCNYAWRRKYLQGMDLKWESPEKDNDEDNIGGSDLGSLAHWILSKIKNPSELDRYLNNREILNILPVKLRVIWRDVEAKSILHEWLSKFLSSKEGMKIFSDKEKVKREAAFRIKLNDEITLSGSMDVVYKDSDVYKILDYKTTLSEKAPEGLYESQLDFYAFVMSEQVKSKITAGIYFLREGKYIEKEYVNTDFEAIKNRIIKAVNKSMNEESLNMLKCKKCVFRKGCKLCSAE